MPRASLAVERAIAVTSRASVPDTVRAPDVAFVASNRLPGGGGGSEFFEGAPDLAAEVVSPNDAFREVADKALDWLAAGARMVLVVEPADRTVTVHRATDDVSVLRDGDVLDGADVVPGFRVPIADIFG